MAHFPIFSLGRIVARDLVRRPLPTRAPHEHLRAAVDWLERAHDVSPDGGVSYGYSLRGGWRPPYRETSGYIAATFFDLAQDLQESRLRERAITICHWLRSVQNADGSFANPANGSTQGIVFDTGQVLFGLVRAFEDTGEGPFLEAAERAGEWLLKVADEEGRWTRNTHNGIPHVYNTRVAWALLRLNAVKASPDRERVARANLDWALSQERDGFFEQCAFTPDVAPFTHTIAYAARGLLESAALLGDSTYRDAAARSAAAIASLVCDDGFIPGQIDASGNASATYCCLTGNCQLAIIWAKLYEESGEARFRTAATASLRYVMSCQDLQTENPDTRGAIKGSQPFWGPYSRLTFPNWSAKFFVDAMRICSRWMS